MKENSIEDDIKIIENLKEAINSGLCYFGSVTMYDCGYQEALEHILSDYKRVLKINKVLLKENKELKNDYENLNNSVVVKNHYIKNSIPVQKVKDKIEELQNGPLKINENNKYYYETEAYNKIIIQVLQELLEGRK